MSQAQGQGATRGHGQGKGEKKMVKNKKKVFSHPLKPVFSCTYT